MKKIILVGYMGSGKSVVAKLLAEKIRLPRLDLDEVISEKAHATIPEIFKMQGEIKFRKLEQESFKEIMQSPESVVLSLGGGTPCYANNHELLKAENVISVYLRTSVDVLYDRLLSEKSQRPLIANLQGEELKEFIAKSLFERSYYYNQAMHVVVTDGKSAETIVSEIEKLLI